MNAIAQTEFNPSLAVINGTIKTTSLKVAEHFGKRHDNIIKAIKNLECSNDFRLLNFEEASYEVDQVNGGKANYTMYEMTKDGFTFLAMGFTGKEAAKWKEAYINAFNAMAEQLLSNTCQLPEPKTKQALPHGLSLDQQDTIKALVKARAEELPKDKQAGCIIKQWSAIKKKFGMSYKEVSPDNFVNMISLITRLPIEGELLPKPENCLTVDLNLPNGLQSITLKFLTEGYSFNRWFISLTDGTFQIKPMPENELSMTFDKWIQYATQERGYVVMKPNEITERLTKK